MPLVIEIGVLGQMNGKPHNNIFHVIEDTGLIALDNCLDIFENQYLPLIAADQASALVYNQLTARPLDALDNRSAIVRPVTEQGNVDTTQFMPAGNHLWTVFETAGIGLKAGGKLISGWTEADFDNGEPDIALLDSVQAALQALDTLLTFASFFLAVYRPAFSVAGIPVASLVTAIRTRGDGTNNRRMNPFIR